MSRMVDLDALISDPQLYSLCLDDMRDMSIFINLCERHSVEKRSTVDRLRMKRYIADMRWHAVADKMWVTEEARQAAWDARLFWDAAYHAYIESPKPRPQEICEPVKF